MALYICLHCPNTIYVARFSSRVLFKFHERFLILPSKKLELFWVNTNAYFWPVFIMQEKFRVPQVQFLLLESAVSPAFSPQKFMHSHLTDLHIFRIIICCETTASFFSFSFQRPPAFTRTTTITRSAWNATAAAWTCPVRIRSAPADSRTRSCAICTLLTWPSWRARTLCSSWGTSSRRVWGAPSPGGRAQLL